MERGYIKYWRKMDDWAWIDDKDTFYVFMRMISFANWKAKAWQHVVVQRGSFITSRNKLAARLGVSVRQLRTIEKKLISSGEIEVKTTNKFTTYIIVKYEEYQSEEEKTTNKTSHERQASDKQATTTKEGKERNKVRSNAYTQESLQQEYPHIDVHQELLKMDKWIGENPGRTKNIRFVRNWLNKIMPPTEPKEQFERVLIDA